MPKLLERAVSQLMKNGKTKAQAYAIATASLKKAGDLNSKGKATAKGTKRGNMTPAQRAKDRAAKKNGGKASDYKYNKKNNTAVKGKVNKNVKRRA